MQINDLLSQLDKVKILRDNEWMACCPAHNDREPSLSVKLLTDKILIHCQAGCSFDSVLKALKIEPGDLFIKNNGHKKENMTGFKEIEKTYRYHDAKGNFIFEVVRFKPKAFAQRRSDGNGGYLWGLGNIQPVIYKLPEIKKAVNSGEPVMICEGEKDVEHAWEMGYYATCNPMGAGKWRSQYTELLKNTSEAVIVADNDIPGRKHANQVAESLWHAGIKSRVIEMPRPDIKDFTDLINANFKRDEIDRLITDTPIWQPPDNNEIEVSDQNSGHHRTDLGNAERLMDSYGKDIRYCYERKMWIIWRGTHWQWDHGGEIMRFAQRTVRNIYTEAASEENEEERKKIADWAKTSESNMRLNAMVAQAQALAKINLSDLDNNNWLLNCQNGTVDLKNGELRLHNKSDYLTAICPVEYDATLKSEVWDSFLKAIFNENERIIAYVQRAMGYTLTGETSEQCLFFCYGTGMNGKSTFLNAFMDILAPYALQADVEMFMSKRQPGGAGHSEDIANLAGRRYVVGSEIEEGRRMSVGKIKQMTGGEKVRASHKNEKEFEFTVTYKIWLNGNHKPEITDTTYSIWRRVKLIPFTITIPKEQQDKQLREKLRNEFPSILAWAVQGCLDWQQYGLEEPIEVSNAVEEYRQEQDILADFIKTNIKLEPMNAEAVISHKDLYDAYENWCKENTIEPVSSRTFAKKLKEKSIVTKFISHGQMKWRYISLKKDEGVDEVDMVDEITIEHPYKEKIAVQLGNSPTTTTIEAKNTNSIYPEKFSSTPDLPPYPNHDCSCGGNWIVNRDGLYQCEKCIKVYDKEKLL